MCGIGGFTGSGNPELLRQMTDSLRHRGPDDEGFYSDGLVNLGARRLSIIDPSTGHQPLTNEDEMVWVVFNGEIYNFKELQQEILNAGHRLRTQSDTEVIVHLYEMHGVDFVNRLNGMFAIALWDKKEKKLLLIRDRLGIKPLYFCIKNREIYFASEINALPGPSTGRQLNYPALHHYFTFKHVPAPMTVFEGVESVLPGEMIQFKQGEFQRKKYWRLQYLENPDVSQKDAESRIYETLKDAVRLRMRSDVPVGALLSGGLDSGAILAFMRETANQARIKTFTLGYTDAPGPKEDDRRFARLLSQKFETDHYEYVMGPEEMIDKLPQIVRAFSQPFSGVISSYFICQLIGQHVKTVLSGDGGDELFGSYLAPRIAQPLHYYRMNRQAVLAGSITHQARDSMKPYENQIEYLERLWRLDAQEDHLAWRFSLYVFNEEEKKRLYTPQFSERIANVDSSALFQSHIRELSSRDPLNRVLELDIHTLLADEVLPFVDRLSMAHSVEIRTPFLDYRLAEYVATLPGSVKIEEGNVKAILKKSLARVLPEAIVDRPKEGFVMPIYQWMRGPLQPFVQEMLAPERIGAFDFLNAKYVSSLLEEHYSSKTDHSAKLWNLVMFQAWLEEYGR